MSDYIPNNGAASTRWLTEEVFKLIDFVQRDEAIYNPRHKYYFCRPYVENFWREVDQKLDKNPGASLAKWTNLRISFRREFTNYLEERVPPCWSYFDRMFFLHPYLRKKQQTSKQGENSLQETLAQISELSNRLERQAAEKANKPTSSSSIKHSTTSNLQQLSNTDNYFDYYDEPEQNNSELDEIIEEDHHERIHIPQVVIKTAGISQHEIKSEHEEEIQEDDFEMRREILLDSDVGDEPLERNDTPPFCNIVGSLGKRSHNSQQQQMRLEHLNRLQTRTYYENLRAKRPRSQERTLNNTTSIVSTSSNSCISQRSYSTSTPAHSSANVSFVRPTISKSNDIINNVNANILETITSPSAIVSSNSISLPPTQSSRLHGQQRCDAANSLSSLNMPSINANNNTLSNTRQINSPLSAAALAAASTPHLEICDCKTDPDAMFLMSLLPDIQKLNGRDRGKIKIAFQNILQDYLYPD